MNKLYVVGIGPGEYEQLTIKAVKALENSDIIVGYTVYVDLIKEYFPDKECFATPMMGEVERVKKAVELASEGKIVSLICSGDAGIYGMASLAFECNDKDVQIEVVAGVTAASAGAAVLGAPIGHDFAVISLSDLLTPFDLIKKRVENAACSDMCMVFYNPSSKKRAEYLSIMCDIILKYQKPQTICGIVKNIGRQDTHMQTMTLSELKGYNADMFTTVFIGNSNSKVVDGKMVTPRGYRL